MRDIKERRIRHVANLKAGGSIRNDNLGRSRRSRGSAREKILKDKSSGSIYKSINIEGQRLYVKLSTKKD